MCTGRGLARMVIRVSCSCYSLWFIVFTIVPLCLRRIMLFVQILSWALLFIFLLAFYLQLLLFIHITRFSSSIKSAIVYNKMHGVCIRPFTKLDNIYQMFYNCHITRLAVLTLHMHFKKKNKFIYLFIYFWLRWVFVAVHTLSLVVASGGYSLLRCVGSSSCGSRALECRLGSCGARA